MLLDFFSFISKTSPVWPYLFGDEATEDNISGTVDLQKPANLGGIILQPVLRASCMPTGFVAAMCSAKVSAGLSKMIPDPCAKFLCKFQMIKICMKQDDVSLHRSSIYQNKQLNLQMKDFPHGLRSLRSSLRSRSGPL